MNVCSCKYPLYHMATKNPQFNLVLEMCVDILAFLDNFEKMNGYRSISEFELIVIFFFYFELVSLLESTYWHLMDDALNQSICVFVGELIF